MPGKKYLTEQAATLLRFAKATTDPDIAAGYLAKAADLSARSEAAPDASPKAPDAMLKLGYTLAAMKEKDKAQSIYENLIKSFPSSPAAVKARERLNSN